MSLRDVRLWMEDRIRGVVPDIDPGLSFRTAPKYDPLDETPETGGETNRQFQIIPGDILRQGTFNGSCYGLHRAMIVAIRYLRHEGASEPWEEFLDRIASDLDVITKDLIKSPPAAEREKVVGGQTVRFFESLEFLDTQLPTELEDIPGVYISQISFSVFYYPGLG